jgi:hypothetical protein
MLYFGSIAAFKAGIVPALRFSSAQACTSVGEWLSLVEHLVRDQGVGGSNPLSPTNYLGSRSEATIELSSIFAK